MDLGLKDKVAVITGASVGIGLAVAEGLAAEGAHIVMAARGEDRLRNEARRVAREHGVKTLAPEEALGLYERNWRHVDTAALDANERALVNALAQHVGGGQLLV